MGEAVRAEEPHRDLVDAGVSERGPYGAVIDVYSVKSASRRGVFGGSN